MWTGRLTESSSTVGSSCEDECFIIIRTILNGIGIQKAAQAFVQTVDVLRGTECAEKRFEKRCVGCLAVESQRDSLDAIGHQGDARAAAVGREELQVLLVLIERQEVSRIRVLAGLRPEDDAIEKMVPQNDGPVADLKEIRRVGTHDRRAERACEISRAGVLQCGGIVDSGAGLFTPRQDIIEAEMLYFSVRIEAFGGVFNDRRADDRRA